MIDATRLRPMLATAAPLPLDDRGWAYEMKWDGVRAIVALEGGRARFFSRSGREITERYPELAALGRARPSGTAILDGEIVVLDAAGRPSFEALQRHEQPAVVMLFDLLEIDGVSLLERPYRERRRQLEGLGLADRNWQIPPASAAGGATALETARELGLEGVVAKRLDGRYQPGSRSSGWRKVKLERAQEVVVGGWLGGSGRLDGRLGSLLVGVFEERALRYAGRVGSGIDEAARSRLEGLLAGRARAACPFTPEPRVPHPRWVRPDLVVEVRFAEWTRAGLLRHPSFRGLRDDKVAGAVVREVHSSDS